MNPVCCVNNQHLLSREIISGAEVLAAVAKKSAVFCDVTPFILMKFN
jgi:hypothetical protein